jgi:hypothetical protein
MLLASSRFIMPNSKFKHLKCKNEKTIPIIGDNQGIHTGEFKGSVLFKIPMAGK